MYQIPLKLIEFLYSETTTNPGKLEALKILRDKIFPPGFNYPGPTTGPFSEHPHGGRGRTKPVETGPVQGKEDDAPSSGGGPEYAGDKDYREQQYRDGDVDAVKEELVTRIMRARGD